MGTCWESFPALLEQSFREKPFQVTFFSALQTPDSASAMGSFHPVDTYVKVSHHSDVGLRTSESRPDVRVLGPSGTFAYFFKNIIRFLPLCRPMKGSSIENALVISPHSTWAKLLSGSRKTGVPSMSQVACRAYPTKPL